MVKETAIAVHLFAEKNVVTRHILKFTFSCEIYVLTHFESYFIMEPRVFYFRPLHTYHELNVLIGLEIFPQASFVQSEPELLIIRCINHKKISSQARVEFCLFVLVNSYSRDFPASV